MEVTLAELWLPILLGGLAVFFASFVMRMVLKHHWTDFAPVPDEEALRAAFNSAGVEGGRQYTIPHCKSAGEMKSPEYQERWAQGPAGFVFLFPKGPNPFGSALMKSLLFNIFAAFMVAYLASNFLPAGASSMDVLQFTGTIAFLTFGGAQIWGPIWMAQSWSVCAKELFDSLVYGLAVGGVFVAFWPAAAAAAGA
jgi:hypothetical protein